MRILPKWLEDAPNAAPEERATACDLRIWIAGQNVCFHLDGSDGKLYDHVTMPVSSLIEGLVHDWWSIFGNRDKEYRLIKHRMGYATPDVRFRFDGAAFEAYANQHLYRNPDVRFWAGPIEVLSRPDAEKTLVEFIEAVLSQLREKGVRNTSAALRWDRVRSSREAHEEAVFCEAAGALGVDPYSISNDDRNFIEQSGQFFTGEPLIEFLAGVAGRASRQETVAWIEVAEARPGYQSRLPDLAPLSRDMSRAVPTRDSDRSWVLGYRRARATRAALNIKTRDRLHSASAFAAKLGNKYFRRAPKVNGLRALVSRQDGDTHVHLRDRAPTPEARVSELFAFTRAVGDAVCFAGTSRSVINDLRDAERQAAGRAFAAEFLAPIDEVLSMQQNGCDVTTIAGELNVSTEVIERQLENKARIRAAAD
jgi:hypothetical protein